MRGEDARLLVMPLLVWGGCGPIEKGRRPAASSRTGPVAQPVDRLAESASSAQRISRSTESGHGSFAQPPDGSTEFGSTDQRINRSTVPRINRSTVAGITLVELLVVVALIGLMLSISYPTLTTGLDGFRLRSAVDRAGAFFQQARLEADRRQHPVQLTADPETNQLRALAVDASWRKSLDFADGVRLVQPPRPQSWVLFPGAPPPRVRLLLEAQTGGRRGLSINVFTGVAEDWKGPAEQAAQ
jgi:type II secretory pathway pseudopilin PulG